MKKYNKFLFALVMGLMSLSACHLDEFPTTSITYQDGSNMFDNIEDVQKFENGMFQSFRYLQYGVITQTEETMCDGFNATVDYGNNYGGVHRMDASYSADDYNTRDMWRLHFLYLKNYNIVIEQAAKYEPADASEQSTLDVVVGEAHFFRACAYLQLVRHFGKAYSSSSSSDLAVPLVLVYDLEEKPARATVQQVYAQIKADLDIAASKLSGVSGKVRSMSPTIDAVNAMYARYYVDTKDYANAAAAAERVINSSAGYKLASTEEEMETEYRNDAGTEPIMQLAGNLSEGGLNDNNSIYTLMTTDATNGTHFRSYYLPTQKLLSLYEDSDLRFKSWFTNSMYPSRIAGSNHTGSYYTFIKYMGNPSLRSNDVPNARQLPKPFLISEMYLISAEANFKNGNTDAAKASLNALQAARGATPSEATEDNIENEWFKETVGEGLRMSCLKRWGKGYSVRTPQQAALDEQVLMTGAYYGEKSMAANDFHWQWPVPTYEMQVNDNLIQNEGY